MFCIVCNVVYVFALSVKQLPIPKDSQNNKRLSFVKRRKDYCMQYYI